MNVMPPGPEDSAAELVSQISEDRLAVRVPPCGDEGQVDVASDPDRWLHVNS